MSDQSPHITEYLDRANEGDRQALNQVMEIAYRELHRIASRVMSGENAGHTLQTTALISEAYLRLFGNSPVKPQNSHHFYALAARQMRRILVDHARGQNASIRGGGAVDQPLDEVCMVSPEPDRNLIALDDALRELEQIDKRAAQVVELRYFGGYTEQEVADVLEINIAKVRRDWEFARAWLLHYLQQV
jgi:RNA polymerase sigma-70 factor (ECF subfamily)